MFKILTIIGTRPNFIKVTQFNDQAKEYPGIDLKFCHTGQHKDHSMSKVFFQQFGINPDYWLELKSKTPASQIGEIIIGIENIYKQYKADLIIVVGDVNSTLAGAIASNKLGISLAHVESGLRSFDNLMPEETNRIITDKLSDYCFVSEKSGLDNLKNEGKENTTYLVGNTMIDTLIAYESQINASHILNQLTLEGSKYVLMTMHRPATVDNSVGLSKLIEIVKIICSKSKLVFPIHPRTSSQLKRIKLWNNLKSVKNLILVDPMDYFSFQKLIKHCTYIITDSGGIQEESTYRQIPCITLRPNTERPVTIEMGTNTLINMKIQSVEDIINNINTGSYKKGRIPSLWDGKASERIFQIINKEIINA